MTEQPDKARTQTHKKSWFARHQAATIIVGAIIFVIIIGISSSDKKATTDSSTKKPAGTKTTPVKQSAATIGQTARDGKFEFVVSNIKCGIPSVSDSTGYVTKAAQGQYCFLTLSVKNIGDKQQLFLESDQKILNAQGQQYSPDTTATLYNSNNNDVFVSEINPGNSVSGTMVYDIPKDQTPVTAELHDSAYSNGIKVNLQ